MQGKVSMVMPCYNKVDAIGAMFDSIIAQKWNNIELILVNDGSTDGTRDVIAEYEPKFTNRGYEVVIVDQKNAGVCAAAAAGLKRITGAYVCCIDADDELEPDYCSVLAGWLEEHSDYDYAMCGHTYSFADGHEEFSTPYISINWQGERVLKFCLLNGQFCMAWVYMLRAEYFRKCKILENYAEPTRGSHEPGFTIPVHAYGGKLKCFREKHLYRYYCEVENAHSAMVSVEKAYAHWGEYARLAKLAVYNLPESVADEQQKERYNKYVDVFEKKLVHWVLKSKNINESDVAAKELVDTILASGLLASSFTLEADVDTETAIDRLFTMLTRRVICVGAKGKRAKRLLPLINKYICKPDECWDENAEAGEIVEGISIFKPDYESIHPYDVFFVLPTKEEAVEEIKNNLPTINYVLWYKQVADTICMLQLMQGNYSMG